MRISRLLLSFLFLSGAYLLPASMAHATSWSDPGFPTGEGTSCIEGTTGITGISTSSTGYGNEDSWIWTGISGDENNFSLTLDFIDGGAPFDSVLYYQFSVAFLQPGAGCDRSFNPNFYDWPPYDIPGYPYSTPPPARFVSTDECAPTVTGSDGSSTGTLEFVDVADGKPEFQHLTLNLEPQTSAGTFTYTISFVCGESNDSGSGGGAIWDIDLDHFLTRVESVLPDTL